MEFVRDIDRLLDAIDHEISLLNQLTTRMAGDLDTRGTQDMARWLGTFTEELVPLDLGAPGPLSPVLPDLPEPVSTS